MAAVRLNDADLIGADDLTKADLTNARIEGQVQLDPACGSDAKLTAGLTLTACSTK